MARLHPSVPLHAPLGHGAYRERDVLRVLEQGLPEGYDIFHNLLWSGLHDGQQSFGEFDVVVVSPGGQLLIVEIKSGEVDISNERLTKTYGPQGIRNVGHQVRRQHAALLDRVQRGELPYVQIQTLLVLPDMQVQSGIVAYPREQIVDALDMDRLCTHVMRSMPNLELKSDQRQQVLDFLANRFEVIPDVATHIGQVQRITTQLASGLATWVPRISHESQTYQIEATAGSGKTQLALALMREACQRGQKARYVCFNRPLAQHLAQLLPPTCDVTTFHQLCRDLAEQQGLSINLQAEGGFDALVAHYLGHAQSLPAHLDLLILDESQDLEPAWAEALVKSMSPSGRLYVMGDSQQQIYDRELFNLPDAVTIRCMDNFRSPQRLVELVNELRLTPEPMLSRSAYTGSQPHLDIWKGSQSGTALEASLQRLWADGYLPSQVAVISYKGQGKSEALTKLQLGGFRTRRMTGRDSAGSEVWSEGPLLAETLSRFKGQSAPAVVLCEIDFETLTERDRRKLLVGLTRGQMRVDLVLSEQAARALSSLLG